MALSEYSYGTVAAVGALTPLYALASGGTYDATTRPTITQVEGFIDRISMVLNVILAENGFAVPVANAQAALALSEFVIAQAVELCHAANGAGPYAPGSQEMRAGTPQSKIMAEATKFVEAHAYGLQALGASRSRSITTGLECRTETDGGAAIVPMFSRWQMGESPLDWSGEAD